MKDIFQITSISHFHEMLAIAPPDHPLISLISEDGLEMKPELKDLVADIRFSADLYAIMYKDKVSGSLGYGRSSYDFEEGTLVFSSPGQVFSAPSDGEMVEGDGWSLLFHPDLLNGTELGKKIEQYSYFSYDANEALHLSAKEEIFISELVHQIKVEYSQNLDRHSHQLIISNLELLLNYCTRFYDRQFFTRTSLHKDFVSEFESALRTYFNSDILSEKGIPSTTYFGDQLNLSANYLSDLLKKETGKGIKEHIDHQIVKKAKVTLLGSNQPVSQIAYELGFEYPQSFSRFFKKKTGMSPVEFRTMN